MEDNIDDDIAQVVEVASWDMIWMAVILVAIWEFLHNGHKGALPGPGDVAGVPPDGGSVMGDFSGAPAGDCGRKEGLVLFH